jgi:polyphosphate kinase 2 (PPK2 family)
VQRALEAHKADARRKPKPIPLVPHPKPTLLDRIDLSIRADRKEYDSELPKLQVRMRKLEFDLFRRRVPLVVVYEGWDAAGKGGNIRRVTGHLDPRGYQVTSIAAPNQEELAHHFLWRFWRPLQKAGHISIFDRSWYGRVAFEPMEYGLPEREVLRAYTDIVDFERLIALDGTVIVKFFLHISRGEQARRFKQIGKDPLESWRLQPEDLERNRHYDDWLKVYEAMLERTDTSFGPWTIVEATDRWFMLDKVYRSLIAAMEARLGELNAVPPVISEADAQGDEAYA